MFNVSNVWGTEIDGVVLWLLAGETHDWAGTPVALQHKPVLIVVSNNAFPGYTPPNAPEGPLTITGIRGAVVFLKESNGTPVAFNFLTRSWGWRSAPETRGEDRPAPSP